MAVQPADSSHRGFELAIILGRDPSRWRQWGDYASNLGLHPHNEDFRGDHSIHPILILAGRLPGEWYERCEQRFDEPDFATQFEADTAFTEQTRELGINQMILQDILITMTPLLVGALP